jgi:hypothetical protein
MSNDSIDISALPAAVQVTVNTHIQLLETTLPGLLGSYFVVGSVALKAFTAGRSDIDFIIVPNRTLNEYDLKELKTIHQQLNNKRLFSSLDGYYLADGSLNSAVGSKLPCARFNEGKFQGFQHFDTNGIDGWILKRYGVCIVGQGAEALPFSLDWSKLLSNMVGNVNTYWRKWAADCKNPLSARFAGLYLNRELVEWGVLGISRIHYTMMERDVASKAAAGIYQLKTVPEKWRRIIREALHIRNEDMAPPQYQSIVQRRRDALGYMNFMIDEINRQFGSAGQAHT